MPLSMHLHLLLLTSLADAMLLPSVHADAHASNSVLGDWWAQVGDRVFYAPPASFVSLSQNVSDYYYMMGSKSALTPTMNKHVVGSEGRWHIMHLPQGPSMLQMSATSHSGDRRATVSALSQLKSGTVLASGFPKYPLTPSYTHPLDEEGQKVEKAAIASVKADTAMDYLKKLVEFPTRSYSNADASNKVEAFLKQQFEAEGLHTCYHTFKDSHGELTNVVGHIPGSQPGAVIVGAHYDSRPFDGDAPGAEDNGSGVASMLAMAKAFMQTKTVPKKSIFFVAFAGEEPGLIGSAHFAEALKTESLPAECTTSSFLQVQNSKKSIIRRNRKIAMSQYRAIIMDEIGWLSPKLSQPTINLESYDAQGKEVMDHMRHSAQMYLGETVDVVHNAHPFGSDHMSFLDNDVAAVLTINGDDEAYPCYHQSCDKIEFVDPNLMMMVTKMNLGAMMRMSMA